MTSSHVMSHTANTREGKNGQRRRKIVFLSAVMRRDDPRANLLMDTLVGEGYEVRAIMPPAEIKGCDSSPVQHISLPPVRKHFWPDSSLVDLLSGLWSRFRNCILLYRRGVQPRPEICVCHEPDSWLVGWLLRIRTKARLAVDLREVYSDRASAFPRPLRRPLAACVRTLVRFLSRRSDHVIHVSENRAKYYGLPAKRWTVIHHYPEPGMFRETPARRLEALRGRFVVAHAGPLRPNYAAGQIVAALEIAAQAVPQLACLVIGCSAGPTAGYQGRLEKLITQGVVHLHPMVPHREAVALMRGSDAGLALVLPVDATHELATPLKLYEYLMAGLPVIGSSVPEIGEVLAQWSCGVVVNAQQPEEIAGAMVKLATDRELASLLSANARRAAETRLNWDVERPRVIEVFRELATG